MGTDVDEDETSETSETQKQIINKFHTTAVWNMDVRQGAVSHTYIHLPRCIQQESGVSIAAHAAR